ncbi:SMP-30/gluconolactonase/LRE family protein [Oceanomicrobium pacificus]|uniref:SMP-30/gluconolactonase/LRE family protein n=1 Tax=Oceanomicrobium pacificus TaxID=2692916 RepID=A0A6B0TT60_9RHOB|nr:SMP-30/gluconolactonase/LRE family protein [Oceanomicrobium pacificus]MXU64412.1 SMP-30/gluconolactonase/LRE family protein [Oceanomicrobium pacificus]
MDGDAKILLAVENTVGESIIWDHRRNQLFWVDIVGRAIHACDPDGARHRTWPAPDFVTSIGLAADGGFVVGLSRDIARWHPDLAFALFARPEPDKPDNRLNEGVVGPDGAFWVGTMQNNLNRDGSPRDLTASTGALYRVTADGGVTRISEPSFGITNTLIWSNGRLITADTLTNCIYSFACAPGTGVLSDRQILLEDHPRGLPDGSAQDADGNIWNCRVVGGASLLHMTPAGTVLSEVDLPVTWPTSCAFGGPGLDRLFVTSARFTMGPDALRDRPAEGALVAVDVGAKGCLAHQFGVSVPA